MLWKRVESYFSVAKQIRTLAYSRDEAECVKLPTLQPGSDLGRGQVLCPALPFRRSDALL